MQKSAHANTLHFPTMAAALAAVLVLLLLNFSSFGGMRGGEDDEGSGIGGTGRMAVPGSESGFGGTGRKPFLGLRTDASDAEKPVTEIEIHSAPALRPQAIASSVQLDIPAAREIELPPVEAPVQVASAAQFTRDSSAIDISEQIQRDLDSNALAFQQLRSAVSNYVSGASELDTGAEAENSVANEAVMVADASTQLADNTDAAQLAQEANTAKPELRDEVSWDAVASFFARNADSQAGDAARSNVQDASFAADDADRLSRPDRIQRPELPPVQRVRPVQRAAILPPRVKPLRL